MIEQQLRKAPLCIDYSDPHFPKLLEKLHNTDPEVASEIKANLTTLQTLAREHYKQ